METLDANGNPVATVGEYEYDGDGKRVKKHVPSTGEVTVFVYDAGGKLIGEYSTIVETQSPKVTYTTADHLGSSRILTDENGTTISRRDFMPYGEEIARTAYGSDSIRQKFTGYERDNESSLDFAQARYYGGGLGRFTGPDDFLNDTHPSAPESWNLYVYVRNNPLNLVDPSGKKAEISWHTDKNGVIHVKIKASFAIYSAEGQNVSKKDLKTYKKVLKNAIESFLTKKFENVEGRSFSVTADISAKVYSSEQKAIESNRDNLVELGSSTIQSTSGSEPQGVGFRTNSEEFDRMAVQIVSDPLNYRGSLDPTSDAGITFAHEFAAHLIPAGHNNSEPNSGLASDGGEGAFTANDFLRVFTGIDPVRIANPPPGRLPGSALSGVGPRRKKRVRAIDRGHTSKESVYRWKEAVKR